MGPRSIRARLTFWYMSLLTITILVLGGTAYGLLGYSLAQDVDRALQGVARALAERSHGSNVAFVPGDIDSLFRQFFGFSPWDRYVERRQPWDDRDSRESVPRGGGLPLSDETMKHAAQGLPTLETVEGLGRYPVRLLSYPVLEGGRVTSVIQVGMSLESVSVARRRFLMVMAALFPLMLLLAGVGGWMLARRALRPVDQMSAAARRISAEHLNARLDSTGSGDELDRLAQTLNEMLGRLDAGFRQIRQFSADASHELQTPLTILKGEIEVALRAPRSREEYQRVLASALEECERLAHLVEGLLLLARADAGVLRMDHQPVDLAHLVVEVDEQVGILADRHAVTLCLGPVEALTTLGDRAHLRRLLLNLVDNSIKYTPPGGRITLALEQEHGRAALQVSDTGIGLSQEEQERIFQRFYRSANTHLPDEGGSGLGLCIAQSIAEAHGGQIHVDSTPGRGSTFTVLLPLHT
jgi:two-component system OmpR family sensor kinase